MSKHNASLPLARWPEEDRLTWEAAIKKPSFMEQSGLAAGWADATRATNIHSYGRWLAYLEGVHPQASQRGLSDRCTKHPLEGYLQQLAATTAPFSVVSSVHGLTMMLQVLAPDRDWKWLERIRNDLKLNAHPVRDKRSKLRVSDEILVATIAPKAGKTAPYAGDSDRISKPGHGGSHYPLPYSAQEFC
jgi:hypothetical protein